MHKDKIFFAKYDYDSLQLVSVKTRRRILLEIYVEEFIYQTISNNFLENLN